jgi:hypothetical protein
MDKQEKEREDKQERKRSEQGGQAREREVGARGVSKKARDTRIRETIFLSLDFLSLVPGRRVAR